MNALATYRGARVLVLGADGFIGRWVARQLTSLSADLHLAVIARAPALPLFSQWDISGEVHQHDLTDRDGLVTLLGSLRPALVVNAVGYGIAPAEKRTENERLARLLNSELPGWLAQALAGVAAPDWHGRRLVHVGSVFEYGNIGGHLPETATARPHGLYGITKLAGTMAVLEHCGAGRVPGLTARVCQVYGPGEHPGRLLPLLLEARQTGELPVLSRGTQRKDFTYVADVAEGLLRLGLSVGSPGEIVNLATGTLLSVAEYIHLAAEVLALPPAVVRLEAPVPEGELEHAPVSISRLRERTGWAPATSCRGGLESTVAFLESFPRR